jgi:sulfur carrier protein
MKAPGQAVTIVLNGVPRDIPRGMTAGALLETLGLARARVAVEVNGRVVARADLPRWALADQDRVELVQFVGGG